MSLVRASPLAGAPDRYDGVAGLASLFVLAYAFLLVQQPILGVIGASALLCVYAVARTGDAEHTAVVAAAWTAIFASLWVASGITGVGVFAILAVVCYSLWRQIRR